MAFAGGGNLVGSGQNGKVAVGLEETTYGTSAAAQMHPGLVRSLILNKDEFQHVSRGIVNERTLQTVTRTAQRFSQTMEGELVNGVPLAMALGYISTTDDPTVGVLKGPTHTTPTKSYLPSFTIFRTYDESSDDDYSVLGCTVDRARFSCELNAPVIFSLEMVGQNDGAVAANPTVTANALGSWNCTLSVDEGQTAYGDGTPVNIDGWSSWNFTIAHNLDVKNKAFTGSSPIQIRQPIPGIFEGALTITRRYIDNDFWGDLCDGTTHSFRINLSDGTVTIPIDFDTCMVLPASENVSTERQSENTATFTVKDINAAITDAVTYVAHD